MSCWISLLVDRLFGGEQEVCLTVPKIILKRLSLNRRQKPHPDHLCKGTGCFSHEREKNGCNLDGDIINAIKDQPCKMLPVATV